MGMGTGSVQYLYPMGKGTGFIHSITQQFFYFQKAMIYNYKLLNGMLELLLLQLPSPPLCHRCHIFITTVAVTIVDQAERGAGGQAWAGVEAGAEAGGEAQRQAVRCGGRR
jgi:hypothetical protein